MERCGVTADVDIKRHTQQFHLSHTVYSPAEVHIYSQFLCCAQIQVFQT